LSSTAAFSTTSPIAGFSDVHATITAFGQNGPAGAMLVRFEGTHDGPYAGFAPSGRPVTFAMVAVVTFDDTGKAIGEFVFLDGDDIAATLAG